MDILFVSHTTLDILILAVSVVITGSMLYFRGIFAGSEFAKSWGIMLASSSFLIIAALLDVVVLQVFLSEPAWADIAQEFFLCLFLIGLALGLYSMVRANKQILEKRRAALPESLREAESSKKKLI